MARMNLLRELLHCSCVLVHFAIIRTDTIAKYVAIGYHDKVGSRRIDILHIDTELVEIAESLVLRTIRRWTGCLSWVRGLARKSR